MIFNGADKLLGLCKAVNQTHYTDSSQLPIVTLKNAVYMNMKNDIACLSDSFEKPTDSPELELKVMVLNINVGFNRELTETCRLLREYSLYTGRVRTYTG